MSALLREKHPLSLKRLLVNDSLSNGEVAAKNSLVYGIVGGGGGTHGSALGEADWLCVMALHLSHDHATGLNLHTPDYKYILAQVHSGNKFLQLRGGKLLLYLGPSPTQAPTQR